MPEPEEDPNSGEVDEEEAPPLELSAPLKGSDPSQSIWTLVAHNRRVVKGWEQLVRNTPENAINCFDWLRMHAMKPIPGRCYALKGKKKAGCWCYEIGSGDRVYYRPDDASKVAKFYYAGSHPSAAPDPPKNL